MQQDIIGIVILLLALVSYALNKIPMVLTAILSMLAMYLLGILDFAEAFSGFSNNVTMMVLGMGLIGVALSQNGIMDIVANKLNSMFSGDSKLGEKQFLLIAGGIITLGSTILNPTLMVMLFLEIVDGMAARPDSPLARKFCYMPMVTASTAGCCFTSISSTTVILASGLLAESGAGLLIANATAKLFGDLTAIPIVTCIIALLVANLVSQVMNNSSAAAIVVPIMILMAEHSGVPIAPVALAAGVGCNMVSATPVCAPMYTLASSVGYRFRDYFVVGGIMNILGIVACSISLYVCYFLF